MNPSLADSAPLAEFPEGELAPTSLHDTIQTVIASLAQSGSALVSQRENGFIWKFKYGSVEVYVQLTGETEEDAFTVWSAVLNLPAKNEASLYQKLLTLNWSDTYEARFGIFNEQVVVLATRSVADLSPAEVSRTITVVATVADDHDDALQAEFGA